MAAEAGKWHKDWDKTKVEFHKKAKGINLDKDFLKVFDKGDRFGAEIKKADMMIIRYSMARSSDKPKFLKPFIKLVTANERLHKKFFLDIKAAVKKGADRAKLETLIRPVQKNARAVLDQAQDQIERIKVECDGADDFDPKLAKSIDGLQKALPREMSKAQAWVRRIAASKDVEKFNAEFEKTHRMISAPVSEILAKLKKDKAPKEIGKKLKIEVDRFNSWCKKAGKLPSRNPENAIIKMTKEFTGKARRVTLAVDKISVPAKGKKK